MAALSAAALSEVGIEIDDPELLKSFQQLRHNHDRLMREKRAVEKMYTELEQDAEQKQVGTSAHPRPSRRHRPWGGGNIVCHSRRHIFVPNADCGSTRGILHPALS